MSLIILGQESAKIFLQQNGQQQNIISPDNLLYQSSLNQRLTFAKVISAIWIMQNLATISICEIVRQDVYFKELFFTYQYTQLTGILALLTLIIICVIRFTRVFRYSNLKSLIMLSIFTIIYALTISAWLAGEKSMYMHWTATIGLVVYDLIVCWTWYLVVYLIIIMIIKSLTWRACIIQLFICGSSVVVFTYVFYELRFVVYAYVVGVLLTYFHLYYHYSLTQLFDGKYKLKNNEYFAGTLLQYANLLIPC